MPLTRRSTAEKKILDQSNLKQVQNELLPMDHVGINCSGSKLEKSSRISNSDASKKAKAALRLAELKQKQVELDYSLRIAAANNEVEMAKLQVTLAEDSDSSELLVDDESHVDRRKTEELERYLTDCCIQEHREEVLVDPKPSINSPLSRVELPKVEIAQFDGEPSNYWMFIRQFESCIEKRVSDNGQRLLYLMYYCKGKAKEAIKGCAMLDPEVGYVTARRILRDRFGQPHNIARALIDGIMDGVRLHSNDAESLEVLATNMHNCEIALQQMNYTADLNAMVTLERIIRRLPLSLQDQWVFRADTIIQTGREPTFSDMRTYVMERARLAASRFGQLVRNSEQKHHRAIRTSGEVRSNDRPPQRSLNQFLIKNIAVKPSTLCVACNGSHELQDCAVFCEMEVPERWELVKRNRLCFKCIKGEHNALGCRERGPCGENGCKGRHHHLLHVKRTSLNESNETRVTHCTQTKTRSGAVYLGTVPVILKGPIGEIITYAFIDNGSDTTLIREDVLRELGITSEPTQLTINTVTGSACMQSNRCKFELASLNSEHKIVVNEAYAVKGLPMQLANWRKSDIGMKWPHLNDVELVDVVANEVTLLIGCDVPEAHWVIEQRIGGRDEPYATKTALGWMLHGPTRVGAVNHASKENEQLCIDFQRLYNHEFNDTSDDRKALSVEQLCAVRDITAGTKFCGHNYEVPLPWRSQHPALPDNFELAVRRLESLRKRFLRDAKLFEAYKNIIDQHIAKGYAVKATTDWRKNGMKPRWYLPHHPVLNPKKPTKVRIVFDCAAKWSGTSLNDRLYAGPDTTSNLCEILMRFRLEEVAVAADIEEMFLRVKVPERDQDALRFLWWEDGDLTKHPIPYKLTVHPFGATSSPFCANFALRKAIENLNTKEMWNCDDVASSCFYVDDYLSSFENVEKAVVLSRDLAEALLRSGFKLRKWLSNRREVLEALSGTVNESCILSLRDKLPCERTLGIEWDTELDVLRFNVQFGDAIATRRGILSCVSTLFDPLGMIAPLLLPVKCLLQELCKQGLGWDEPIPPDNEKRWQMWKESMQKIGSLVFDRCVKNAYMGSCENTELHVFCDASEIGYGAVAYLRYVSNNGIRCSLVFGKARVAPLKTVTIPRLELMAAVLGVRVYQLVSNSLRNTIAITYFWTDSTIVLYYIRNISQGFSTFVANRLAVIHDCSRPGQWNYVKSEDNPADRASRGCYVGDKSLNLWLCGPDFLRSTMDQWPKQPNTIEIPPCVELKKVCAVVISKRSDSLPFLAYHSNWFRLLKSVAWWLRYKDYLMIMSGVKELSVSTGRLRMKEINRATHAVVKVIQSDCFPKEREWLIATSEGDNSAYKRLIRNSSLRKLCPILVDGLICVGGRLDYSEYGVAKKHPVILPREHHVTALIMSYHHEIEGHCGPSQLLASVRQKYWVIHGKVLSKRVVNNCAECRRRNATIGSQIMAPLPKSRVEPGFRAFQFVGIDYYGPLLVKKNRSMEKRYGCLFTCLQTRAVHIEIAHDLSTDSFLMALMRFMGRRGNPSEIYSDNGSCFVGAEAELRTYLEQLSQERISDRMLQAGVQWNFNPPAASHRGGVWERMIRSVRRLLTILPREQTLSDEMLLTFTVEAERIINGRPLVPIGDERDERLALTPNSLMLLHDNVSILTTENLQTRYTRCWKRVNHMASVFWSRWVREYLPTLQTRQKWLHRTRNLRVGDVVLVLTEPKRWGKWPLGVVTGCEEGGDGVVRTVVVKTAGRELRRDIRKLALLEGVE